jgi:hypothetical protein
VDLALGGKLPLASTFELGLSPPPAYRRSNAKRSEWEQPQHDEIGCDPYGAIEIAAVTSPAPVRR